MQRVTNLTTYTRSSNIGIRSKLSKYRQVLARNIHWLSLVTTLLWGAGDVPHWEIVDERLHKIKIIKWCIIVL